ncbi:four helix bundle protein [candidate division KSB1 bacterium]
MGAIEGFEDLIAWKRARELSMEISQITNSGKLNLGFSLKDHMRRTSGSIMDNIAEGFEGNGYKEFKQFLSISKGSSGELKSQLYRCLDQNYIDESKFKKLYYKIDEVSKMLSGLIRYLVNSNYKGYKFG